jgi:hypothetical protein
MSRRCQPSPARIAYLCALMALACGDGSRLADIEIADDSEGATELTDLQQAEIAQLEALGYIDGDRAAGDESMVVVHDRNRAQQGFNLYSSEHAKRAFLLDMEGKLIHMWELPRTEKKTRDQLRRLHLMENGELIVQLTHRGIYRLDRDSRILWSFLTKVHHDLDVAEDGTMYVLTKQVGIYPSYDPDRPIRNEAILAVSPEGELLHEVWILDALQKSSCCAHFLDDQDDRDIFHTNTVFALDGSLAHVHPAFRAGNVLTSFRTPNAIAVVDMDAGRVVWGYQGPFTRQHDPTLLANGHILLFDNRAPQHGDEPRSRVIELDPFEDEIVWKFPPTTAYPLESSTGSTSQRLANGNTLITETRGGRILEVTPGMDVVWTFVNPARVQGEPDRMARIFEMRRLPADLALDWVPPHDYPDDAMTAFQLPISESKWQSVSRPVEARKNHGDVFDPHSQEASEPAVEASSSVGS